MIIKRLELENIRSYERTAVELPLGRTLFEGDIGTGKSTLLMAIEFAFFGLGTEAGASLLRMGSSEGRVAMVFEADGAQYRVERALVRKGKRVHQTEGTLMTPDGPLNLSPSELKEKMLEVLQFNEVPDPKAQSWIYRYAVYTPQEEMKTVLALSPDLRLQILRRAFRIEDYKVAAENAAELSREVRRKASEFAGMAAGASELRASLGELDRQRRTEMERVSELRKKERDAERELEGLTRERDRLRQGQLKLDRLRGEIELQNRRADEKEELAAEEREEGAHLAARIEAFRRSAKELAGLRRPSDLAASELERKADKLQEKAERLTALEATVMSKIDDYHSVLREGKCPVCDRPVDAEEFVGKEKAKMTEHRHLAKELEGVKVEEKQVRKLWKLQREYEQNAKALEGTEEELRRHSAELKRRTERAAKVEVEAERARRIAGDRSAEAEPLSHLSKKLAETGEGVEAAEKRLRELRDFASKATQKLESMAERQEEARMELARREGAALKKEVMQEHEIWLTDYFVPTLQLIEKSVMQALNQEFDSNFRSWFAMLVDDPDKEVRVDESFTPVVSQDGYEQEVYYLSGGEKTSVSLAYRLALNTLVQKVSTAMRSNILILDEPTDGFSNEQLSNVREVLDEIKCPQVIVVSHEKELESFADQVYRVVKEGGVSKVLSGTAQDSFGEAGGTIPA